MGITTTTQEITCAVSPSRMFKALVLDSHNLLPKLVPQSIKSIDVVHGDGVGAGTIKQTNFHEGSHFKYMKHRVDSIDTDNFECKYTLIEGDVLGDVLESITYEVKIETSGSGSVCKTTSHYRSKAGVELKEEAIKEGKEKASGMSKVVEAYLVANPDVYA
ncbi:hypothetical protein LguiA_020202 [Lonicera macranthoides]